jgi:hypothetical protein
MLITGTVGAYRIIEVPEAIARLSWQVGGGVAAGVPSGTLLLGNNNVEATGFTGNTNTAYPFCHSGQATATATTAYFYDNLGLSTSAVHVCVWNTSGVLLACSSDISLTGSTGWRSASISVSITESTSYVIGVVAGATGLWTTYDTSSPALPSMAPDSSDVTFGSEGDITITECNYASGSLSIYITN